MDNVLFIANEESPNLLLPPLYDIVWSSLIFGVILIFFWKYVLPKLQVILDERTALIEDNIDKATVLREEAEGLLEEYAAQLVGARHDAAQIRDRARADGQKIIQEARASAQEEAARISASAQVQIDAEKRSALVSLHEEVGSLAIDLASRVVKHSLSDDARAKDIVDDFLTQLEKDQKTGVVS